jgi:hypothetical protein
MIDYRILIKSTPFELEKEVLDYLERKWECVGGMTTATHNIYGTTTYLQAMIKKVKNE